MNLARIRFFGLFICALCRAFKSSEFNIEETHLTDIDRISKFFALVLVAFVWAYKAGIFQDVIYPIKIKNHGRKAHGIFKYVLTYIANVKFNNDLD